MLWTSTNENVSFKHLDHYDYLAGWKYMISPAYRARTHEMWSHETKAEITIQVIAALIGMTLSGLAAALLVMFVMEMAA